MQDGNFIFFYFSVEDGRFPGNPSGNGNMENCFRESGADHEMFSARSFSEGIAGP